MKRTVIAAAALSAVIALAGCGSGQSSSSASTSSASSSESSTFAASSISDVLDSSSSSASSSSASASSSSAARSSSASSALTASSSSAESAFIGTDLGTTASSGDVKMLSNFEALSQYPELPNGCEITSLTATLNYLGFPVDKGTLSDEYLAKGPVGSTDFHEAYVGNPRSEESFGCYAPVLTNCANDYLADQGSSKRATDLTGADFQSLFSYIDQGIPVIVWGTQYCQEGYYTVTWHVNGKDLTWFRPEHCMVLVGYDLDSNLVYVSDPMEGAILSYDLDLFESRYDSIFKQAIVIQ